MALFISACLYMPSNNNVSKPPPYVGFWLDKLVVDCTSAVSQSASSSNACHGSACVELAAATAASPSNKAKASLSPCASFVIVSSPKFNKSPSVCTTLSSFGSSFTSSTGSSLISSGGGSALVALGSSSGSGSGSGSGSTSTSSSSSSSFVYCSISGYSEERAIPMFLDHP